MKILGRINNNLLNSRALATTKEIEEVFALAPNSTSKTIRLFPHNAIGFFTEGLGEIYDVNATSKNFEGINGNAYKWKIRGHQVPKVKFATRSTGGAIGSATAYGANNTEFVVAFQTAFYNKNDTIKLKNNQFLFVKWGPVRKAETVYEYGVQLISTSATATVLGAQMMPGVDSGPASPIYPELSSRGFLSTTKASEEHINYLTKTRYDWTWSAEAAATKYLVQDMVSHNGKDVKLNYIMDELYRVALEQLHFRKEIDLIHGVSTMGADGRCWLQDPENGQDIVKGDGLLAQMDSSMKQTYTELTIDLIEDALMDLAYKSPKKTGNTWILSTGLQGYNKFGKIMRAEHKSGWSLQPNSYVTTKNGKIQLGAEYNAFTFQGNTIVVGVNGVFDHPANVSDFDSEGRPLSSSNLLFIDASYTDGVKNIQMIAKNGRSFITSEIDGVGGQDGKTSGKASTPVEGSSKTIVASYGVVMHNPYTSMLLEKKIV